LIYEKTDSSNMNFTTILINEGKFSRVLYIIPLHSNTYMNSTPKTATKIVAVDVIPNY